MKISQILVNCTRNLSVMDLANFTVPLMTLFTFLHLLPAFMSFKLMNILRVVTRHIHASKR